MTQETADQIIALICIGLMMVFMYVIAFYFLRRRKQEEVQPVTEERLIQYDELPPGMAVALAWTEPDGNPLYHFEVQEIVRTQMPVLARALDRMVEN